MAKTITAFSDFGKLITELAQKEVEQELIKLIDSTFNEAAKKLEADKSKALLEAKIKAQQAAVRIPQSATHAGAEVRIVL